MGDDLISRQDVIDVLNDGAELLRRVLDETYVVGDDRAKYEWGIGLIESYISDMNELPSAQQWIPCSERLPEENDYKSCIECLDGAVWYFTKNGTMGMGYYYKSTKEWSTTDDLKTDGKVIAWMPLPEPYKGKDNETD